MAKPSHRRKRGAPPGNRNAAGKRATGLRGSFYLNVADLAVLDDYLTSQGITPSKDARLQLARDLFHTALRAIRDRQDEPPIII